MRVDPSTDVRAHAHVIAVAHVALCSAPVSLRTLPRILAVDDPVACDLPQLLEYVRCVMEFQECTQKDRISEGDLAATQTTDLILINRIKTREINLILESRTCHVKPAETQRQANTCIPRVSSYSPVGCLPVMPACAVAGFTSPGTPPAGHNINACNRDQCNWVM